MKIIEYVVCYETKENPFGDCLYSIKTKKEAMTIAKDLVKKGSLNVVVKALDDDDIREEITIN